MAICIRDRCFISSPINDHSIGFSKIFMGYEPLPFEALVGI